MPQVFRTIPPLPHTPEPWTVEQDGGPYTICAKGGAIIATVGEHWTLDRTMDGANARLIAAAPALYHALRQVAAHYLQHWSGDVKRKMPPYLAEVTRVLDTLETAP